MRRRILLHDARIDYEVAMTADRAWSRVDAGVDVVVWTCSSHGNNT